MKSLAIDVRMVNHSGIGTYIKNIIPRIVRLFPEINFYLIGNPNDLKDNGMTLFDNARVIACRADIYTLTEQFAVPLKLPSDTHTLWVPHYNAPAFLPLRHRLLVTIHDVNHLAMSSLVEGMHKKIYATLMFKATASRAANIICVSHFTASELQHYVGIDGTKVHVVHNGIDDSWFNPPHSISPHSKPYILYVGNVKPHKNLRRLLEAYRLLMAQTPHDLLIIGKKDGLITGEKSLNDISSTFDGRVSLLGYVDQKNIGKYFSHADVFVFPSLYEGFGFPPLEAMACGVPVVSADRGALPEVLGDAAILVDPYDSNAIAEGIRKVITDQKLRQKLVNRGVHQAREFTWARASHKTAEIIRACIHGDEILQRRVQLF